MVSTLEVIVLVGFIAVVICLNAVLNELHNKRSQNDEDLLSDLVERLTSIEAKLDQIEKHTWRVADPLYEQDAFDREHMVGRYDPDRLR